MGTEDVRAIEHVAPNTKSLVDEASPDLETQPEGLPLGGGNGETLGGDGEPEGPPLGSGNGDTLSGGQEGISLGGGNGETLGGDGEPEGPPLGGGNGDTLSGGGAGTQPATPSGSGGTTTGK